MTLAGGGARRKKAADSASPDRAARLLDWYDRHRRVLPWRAGRGEASDAYRVWLSEIMLQQTTVKAVAPYFEAFVGRWANVTALAQAPREEVMSAWAGLGYYSRARNLHACAQLVAQAHGGRFPDTEEGLRALPGVGPYTAAAIAAIAFGRATMPLDGNIERVTSRLFAVDEPLPGAKPRLRALAQTLVAADRPGDCAQAAMDLGATICTPRKPACALCPLNADCAGRQRGDPEAFPRKAVKREGALRRGAAFVAVRGAEILLRTRPDKGLLGGMSEVPTTEWSAVFDDAHALEAAPRFGRADVAWRRAAEPVRHVFTHFPLELTVYSARLRPRTRAPSGMRFVGLADLDREALPAVMWKAIEKGLAE